MKKLLSLTLIAIILLGTFAGLCSCGNKNSSQIAGIYEMVDISGTVTFNGQKTELEEDLYDYYRIILYPDGNAKVAAKAKNNSTQVEEEAEWEFKNGTIRLKSSPQGLTVVEEMQWKNGTIIYNATQSSGNMTVDMTLTLQKRK